MAIAKTRRADTFILAVVATFLSVASFYYFLAHDKILLYGDAVAHINIARRVFDSQFPGFSQLGTVWLPLPHMLMLPFIVNDKMWSSGVGGSLVSMAAYVAGAIAVARIFWTDGLFIRDGEGESGARAGGWIAALVYLLNPNLLYLQSTAMTEPLGLALMVWATYFYCCFVVEQRRALLESIEENAAAIHGGRSATALLRCGVLLAAAMLTRYDYWFFAAVVAVGVVLQLAKYRNLGLVQYKRAVRQKLRRSVLFFVVVLAIVPAFWLTYNQVLFGNALEFANGKYSARAIAERSALQGHPQHPGSGNLTLAATYYWKTMRLNVGDNKAATAVVILALIGGVALALSEFTMAALLFSPLLFYAASVAYGGIPIFIPDWWPFSYYNVRYGIELLPAVCVGCGYVLCFFQRRVRTGSVQLWIVLFGGTLAAAYAIDWARGPVCLREAEVNSTARIALHKQIAAELRALPSDATFVVSLTEHVGAFQRAGIPLRRTWNESSHKTGEQEFAFPLTRADYVIAFDGDPVSRMVAGHLELVKAIATFNVPGEKRCVIYKATREPR